MYKVDDAYSVAFATSSRTELSAQQRQSLAAAKAAAIGAGASEAEAFRALHRRRVVANPEPQGRVPRTEWATDELKNLLLQAQHSSGVPVWLVIRSLESSADPQVAALGKLVPEVFTLRALNLENPMVAQALSTLKALGVLDDALYEEITTVPDPAWQGVLDLPSAVEEACGFGSVLEWAEFEVL